MAKDKKKNNLELRPVEEDAGEDRRVVRLHGDKVEEYEELPVVKVGMDPLLNEKGEPLEREDMKTRSKEPDVGSLIESEFQDLEEGWDLSALATRPVPWGWTALVSMAFAAGIIWSLVQVKQSVGRRIEVENEAKALVELEDQSVMDAEATLKTIEKVTHDFFDSRSVEELMRYVRHPVRVKPLMEQYYADAPPAPHRITEFVTLDPVTISNRANFWFVGCVLDNGEEAQVLVEVFSEKKARVDWESHVSYQPIPWDDFAKLREGGYTGDFRVFAEVDFFSHEFADSKTLGCLRLTTRDSEEVLYGYMERESDLWRRINKQIQENSGIASPMILRLHVPEGLKSKRGVVIKEMLAPRWVFLDSEDKS